jgi:uncharacterized membrane protein
MCFTHARDAYRRGLASVRPLSLRQQTAAACAVTFFCFFGAVINAVDGQWKLLPIFLLNPMLLLTWLGVAQKRALARSEAANRSTAAVAQTPAVGAEPSRHWWTSYRNAQREEDEQVPAHRRQTR